MRHAQVVMGPAGSGKSTYCSTMIRHCENIKRTMHVVNLDPAAEAFDYPVAVDVRDLISLDDVAEELQYGPNGGLIYCMEFLIENIDWLRDELGVYEDDYLLFDCPGQIELYTHMPIMRHLMAELSNLGFRMCGVYLLDSQFIVDSTKYFSGVLSAMAAMIQLEIPHVNVMSKMDLVSSSGEDPEDDEMHRDMHRFMYPDQSLLEEEASLVASPKYRKLNRALAAIVEDYSMVSFIPLNSNSEDSIRHLLMMIDTAIQYGEDVEPRGPEDENGRDEDGGADIDDDDGNGYGM